MNDFKRILIVDDSEIDREILKSILNDDFEVLEADNGYTALQMILKEKEVLDAVLLDVSMPFLDGLSVLRILRENDLDDVHIFMISAEATKDNIEKASQYHIDEFIRKPFDRDEILKRVRENLGVKPKADITKREMDEIRSYISDLESLYKKYLKFSGKDSGENERREHFMKILMQKYPAMEKGTEQAEFMIEIISKAAYFCNIGDMLIQNIPADGKLNDKVTRQHTVLGADIIRLNYSKRCRQFVQVCTDICLHHHERYDGRGFPQGIGGSELSVYAQMCGLLEAFDNMFFKYVRHNGQQFDYVLSRLRNDDGLVSSEVFSLLADSKSDIIKYYESNYI